VAELHQYDAVIIGSGQGGTPLAMKLAARGEKTALIEARNVGGTCVNYGCTPTKTLVAGARVAHMASRAEDYGVLASAPSVDMVRVRERKRSIVDMFRGGSEKALTGTENLTLIRGSAAFKSSERLLVTASDGNAFPVTATRFFINTGTHTAVPPISGLESVDYLTNESVMELAAVPKHLIVIGGGYVGCEFGQMFARYGSQVTVIQRGSQILPHEDQDAADALTGVFRGEGIRVLTGTEVTRAQSESGGVSVRVKGADGEEEIHGSHLLLAAGRAPATTALRPGAAGIQTDSRGYIRVNDRLETNVSGIYALGDVKGGPAFTHISYDDSRILLRNLYGDGRGTVADRLVPYTVFTDPQLGRVGMTEKEAREAGVSVRVAKLPMTSVARALEIDETAGFMKAVVAADTDRILGFTMLGPEGGEVAGAVQIAMMGGLPYTSLRDAAFAHPTMIESLNNLFAALE